MKYYILVKKKNSKNYAAVIPAKAGVTVAQIKRNLRKGLAKGFTAKIISEQGLRNYIRKLKKKYRK